MKIEIEYKFINRATIEGILGKPVQEGKKVYTIGISRQESAS